MRRQGWLTRRRITAAVLVAAALAAAGFLVIGGPESSDPVETATAEQTASVEKPGLPWEAEPAEETAPPPKEPIRPPEKNGVAIGGPESMPPASAGNNGSYTPRPAHEREKLDAITFAGSGTAEEDAALLVGDTAIAPFNAPDAIKGAISAANQITDQPYVWGGGHAGWRSRGYDCSGAVSYALAGGGLINRPATSGELMHWGSPGRGRWLTIYANPGHVYAVIAGLRWDTVGLGSGVGPRWHPADFYPDGYVARHIPGL
jgi:cell wall-associated NlpC family hydrolase